MPALRELIWVEEDRDGLATMDPTSVFFRNLPSTLIDLHIHWHAIVEPDQSTVASIFDQVHGPLNIERLTLSGVNSAFLDHVFERLTPVLEKSGSQQGVKLPKLKAIFLKWIFYPANFNQDKVLEMLERRFLHAGGLNQDPFQLEFPSTVPWQPQFKVKLKEMIGHGLKVEISEAARPVDWL